MMIKNYLINIFQQVQQYGLLITKVVKSFKYKKMLSAVLLLWLATFSCYRIKNYPVEFYGLVLDQEGNPIPGVRVTTEIVGHSPLPPIIGYPIHLFFMAAGFERIAIYGVAVDRTIHRKTDKHGIFKIKGYYGNHLYFINGKGEIFYKDRYSYIPGGTPYKYPFGLKSSNFNPNANHIKYHMADRENPIVFRMRRLEEPTFLIRHPDGNVGIKYRNISVSFGVAPSNNQVFYYDIIKNVQFGPDKAADSTKGMHTCDLLITGKWDESNDAWKITFTPGTEKGGIQIQNKRLYMAPKDGYKSEVSFYVKPKSRGRADFIYLAESPNEPYESEMKGKGNDRFDNYYFYLKSRDGGLHSRIEMARPKLNDKGIWMDDFQIVVNPYAGERNLETSSPISYGLKRALKKEVLEAFAKDLNARIPPPPPEMYKIKDSQIPKVMAERQRIISSSILK